MNKTDLDRNAKLQIIKNTQKKQSVTSIGLEGNAVPVFSKITAALSSFQYGMSHLRIKVMFQGIIISKQRNRIVCYWLTPNFQEKSVYKIVVSTVKISGVMTSYSCMNSLCVNDLTVYRKSLYWIHAMKIVWAGSCIGCTRGSLNATSNKPGLDFRKFEVITL